MKANFTISIKNPCSELFSVYEKTTLGGFCKSCEKEVIDFRNMTDMQIEQVLKEKGKTTCGYFRKSQLHQHNNIAMETENRATLNLIKVAAIAVLALNTLQTITAQENNSKTETFQNLKSNTAQEEFLRGEV